MSSFLGNLIGINDSGYPVEPRTTWDRIEPNKLKNIYDTFIFTWIHLFLVVIGLGYGYVNELSCTYAKELGLWIGPPITKILDIAFFFQSLVRHGLYPCPPLLFSQPWAALFFNVAQLWPPIEADSRPFRSCKVPKVRLGQKNNSASLFSIWLDNWSNFQVNPQLWFIEIFQFSKSQKIST